MLIQIVEENRAYSRKKTINIAFQDKSLHSKINNFKTIRSASLTAHDTKLFHNYYETSGSKILVSFDKNENNSAFVFVNIFSENRGFKTHERFHEIDRYFLFKY